MGVAGVLRVWRAPTDDDVTVAVIISSVVMFSYRFLNGNFLLDDFTFPFLWTSLPSVLLSLESLLSFESLLSLRALRGDGQRQPVSGEGGAGEGSLLLLLSDCDRPRNLPILRLRLDLGDD